jgi:hypothetical protein
VCVMTKNPEIRSPKVSVLGFRALAVQPYHIRIRCDAYGFPLTGHFRSSNGRRPRGSTEVR